VKLLGDRGAGTGKVVGSLVVTLIPGVPGLLLFMRLHPKYAWVSRISFA
jgi:hypothetical protein